MTNAKMYNAVFTPAAITRTKDSLDRPFVRARGLIARADGTSVERTVLVQGKNASAISRQMKKGRAITLRGIYETAPAQGDAKRGGEFFTALCLPRAKAPAVATA
jgi:hypothetical protein